MEGLLPVKGFVYEGHTDGTLYEGRIVSERTTSVFTESVWRLEEDIDPIRALAQQQFGDLGL